jgi:hypothetical protein
MTAAIDDSPLSGLFAHALRADWGVGVLAAESDGKRRYLFEDGRERVLAPDFFAMMRRVETPSREQQATYVRLKNALLARRSNASQAKAPGLSVSEQIARLRETYATGLADPGWDTDVRGEFAAERTPHHRHATIRDAQERLSQKSVEELIEGRHFGRVWDQVAQVLSQTDLVPRVQVQQTPAGTEQERSLALAVRELLYGVSPYDERFERFLAAFAAAFAAHARWELATVLAALVHPAEHVCVDLAAFRRQARVNSSCRSVATRPSGAAYTRLLAMARRVADRLGAAGEAPRDLWDVREFIAFTLRPAATLQRGGKPAKAPPARVPKPGSNRPQARP